MKVSTPSAPKPPEPLSILLIGPPGGGKTALSMQFPDMAFFDCDRNLDGAERFIRTKNKDLSFSYEPITYNDDGSAVEAALCFDRLIDKIDDLTKAIKAKQTTIRTASIDGLTMINEMLRQKVMKAQKSQFMETRYWDPFKSDMLKLLVAKLRGLGITTIVTCHEFIKEKSDPQKMMVTEIVGYTPAVQSGITDFFGGFFTDIWRCFSVPKPGSGNEFKIVTEATGLSPYLKNSVGLPGEISVKNGELAFDKLKPFLNGKV